MASALISRLVESLERRSLFHTEALAKELSLVVRVHGAGVPWEYGPDFEDSTIDVLALGINGSMKQKAKLDRLHSLPVLGAGYRIVSGLLPRDAEQFVVFDGREVEAKGWTFDFDDASSKGKRRVLISAPGRIHRDIFFGMVVAEIGEVNYARHIETIDMVEGTQKPFEQFASIFARRFPDCEYASLLSRKLAGIVQH